MELKFEEGVPLYQQVAQFLQRQISSGTYPVGSLLPTESELAEGLNVSRHTIRQAIGELRRRNLLSARKGVGTRVEAPVDDWRARFAASSRTELFDFARETAWTLSTKEQIEVRGSLATEMGVRPGRKMYHLEGPRHYIGDEAVLCYNEAFLDPRLKHCLDGIDTLRVALFTLIENASGERVKEIRQEIRAIPMPAHVAAHLGHDEGAICVKMTRRYLGSGNRLLEYAIQYYAGDKFVYHSRLSST